MTHSKPPSTAATALDSLLSSQPGHGTRSSECQITCCCALSSCAIAQNNNLSLQSLERDLQQAAQIGHALLARHDAYTSQVDEERREMSRKVEKLECEKNELECTNRTTIEENKYLLQQLEQLNNDLTGSHAQLDVLKATLDSSQREIDRLASLAAQTTVLEAQLTRLETEQASLQGQVFSKDEEIQKAKGAERTIAILSEQLDRIEKEHQEEQARHSEVVARLERRNVVQKELESAIKKQHDVDLSSESRAPNHEVVSTFVKEILQDNANLQMGIIELRDLLTGSNQEVENLRQLTLLSQPQTDAENGAPLKTDFSGKQKSDTPFHVHHHYHAAPTPEIRKDKALRRPKKKRNVSSPGFGAQTPRSVHSPQIQPVSTASAATILSYTNASIPPYEESSPPYSFPSHSSMVARNRESRSVRTSPSSSYREQSVFDMEDDSAEFSRPTTPSTSIASPCFPPKHYKQGSDVSIRSLSNQPLHLAKQSLTSVLHATEKAEQQHTGHTALPDLGHGTIPEEPEDEIPIAKEFMQAKPRLLRATSAESIFSNNGFEARPLRPKPSQLLSSSRPSFGPSTTFVQPVTSSTAAVGKNSVGSRLHDSSKYTRLLLANNSSEPLMQNPTYAKQQSAFGKKLGGWMVGKWGSTPFPSATGRLSRQVERDTLKGDNQPGRLIATQIEAVRVNNALLEEALEGG